MRKQFLLILILFPAILVSAQVGKNDLHFSFNGNYHKSNDEFGVTTNILSTQSKQLSLAASLEFFLSESTAVGIGLEYMSMNEFRKSWIFFNETMQAEELDIDSKIFFPTVHFARYFLIVDKFYLSPALRLGYGQLRKDLSSEYISSSNLASSELLIQESGMELGAGSFDGTSDDDFFIADLTPELNYFFSNGFGLSLSLGGINYTKLHGDSDKSQWVVSFDPAYWAFGFKVKL